MDLSAKTGVKVLIAGSVLLFGILYFSNLTTDRKKDVLAEISALPQGVSFETYEEQMLNKLDESARERMVELRKIWRNAAANPEKAKAAHDLAHSWKDLGNEYLELFYHHHAALAEDNADELIATGDKMNVLFRSTQDTLIKNNLLTFALRSYEAALERRPNDLELKVKVGSAYVDGTAEPMKGISMLREVLEKDPQNLSALIMLGRFSILSGQYDKAKQHLDKVLQLEPNNSEAIYFMAITQEGLGNYEKAIELLEACKKIVANPAFDAEISGYIEQLKNKIK